MSNTVRLMLLKPHNILISKDLQTVKIAGLSNALHTMDVLNKLQLRYIRENDLPFRPIEVLINELP